MQKTLIREDLPYSFEEFARVAAILGDPERLKILAAIQRGEKTQTFDQKQLDALLAADLIFSDQGYYRLKPTMPVEASRLLETILS